MSLLLLPPIAMEGCLAKPVKDHLSVQAEKEVKRGGKRMGMQGWGQTRKSNIKKLEFGTS